MGKETFGIAKAAHNPQLDELLEFSQKIDWDYVADKLVQGEIDDKVAVAIMSDNVPVRHNGLDLKALYKHAYPNQIKSFLKRAESHD